MQITNAIVLAVLTAGIIAAPLTHYPGDNRVVDPYMAQPEEGMGNGAQDNSSQLHCECEHDLKESPSNPTTSAHLPLSFGVLRDMLMAEKVVDVFGEEMGTSFLQGLHAGQMAGSTQLDFDRPHHIELVMFEQYPHHRFRHHRHHSRFGRLGYFGHHHDRRERLLRLIRAHSFSEPSLSEETATAIPPWDEAATVHTSEDEAAAGQNPANAAVDAPRGNPAAETAVSLAPRDNTEAPTTQPVAPPPYTPVAPPPYTLVAPPPYTRVAPPPYTRVAPPAFTAPRSSPRLVYGPSHGVPSHDPQHQTSAHQTSASSLP
ncbi:hypothetical protein DACRYDRAFT_24155 [Dacryopinax primogenitus]|uniref:Uncharacterized protein n=1 Tax=Dacryopinax primogenitus (strain DJM 731) TaxID=1858805 RepID=M5G5Q0_DACPD|nr:uncharacterized protein DACRYDRAFT_24155 [Dacryopinax primogenitus]EJT99087.1 hypothetical protein DACRYDRAFT_24155 [Dacryopinax primogenitus]